MSDIHFQPAVFFSRKKKKKKILIKNKRELYGAEIIKAGSLKRTPTRCNRSLWLCGVLLAVWMRPWCPLSHNRYSICPREPCAIHSTLPAVTWCESPDPQLAEELGHNKFVSAQPQLYGAFGPSSHKEKVAAVCLFCRRWLIPKR